MIGMVIRDDQVPGIDHHVLLVHLPPVVVGLRHFVWEGVFSGLQASSLSTGGLSKAHESARAPSLVFKC